jgi:hypothetical protein
MRSDFFVCDIEEKRESRKMNALERQKLKIFNQYASEILHSPAAVTSSSSKSSTQQKTTADLMDLDNDDAADEDTADSSSDTDSFPQKGFNLISARSVFLEVSQFSHLQYDTLRRAKHSTSVMLYHLHNPSCGELRPTCSYCKKIIATLRWHYGSHDLCEECFANGPALVPNIKNEYAPFRIYSGISGEDQERDVGADGMRYDDSENDNEEANENEEEEEDDGDDGDEEEEAGGEEESGDDKNEE